MLKTMMTGREKARPTNTAGNNSSSKKGMKTLQKGDKWTIEKIANRTF